MATKKTTSTRKPAAAKTTSTKGATKGRTAKATKTTPPASEPKPDPKPAKAEEPKRMSAINAAAKVLAESKEPLNAKQMVEAMAAKGYWSSPGGKTPHATLYSAILREINTKGQGARFKKTERGKFAANG
ncbi:HTH domain-containing protein [Blastopirellula sp. J2-11]|uniref:winged helix-turn-helix domain-containing protein n=1 Tax=Blastopirellula sp. J2-11 TaxID=2943192 RepID=UPI0021C6CEC1|nr:HTH domain-containing protein [Blastopirellula sp. J2-11]UUO05338.1 HTH domain-containing protein [Blastopirellula sp. J2-11]